ncbi:MAG: T9SS type A sorting domain-containing protein [Lewinellaceae bacterium]|nr:T9SS type A sorting domain-containing protein [Lewinellaceae bacterium]
MAPVCSSGNLHVYNAAGVLMYELPDIVSGQAYTIDVSYWPAAVYFVTATTREQGVGTRKLVVQH